MSVTRIASRYAKSLIDLAVEKNKLERVTEDVTSFKEVTKVRDFYLLLKSPIIKGDKKWAIIQKLFGGKYDELTMAFLKILIQKGREMYLPEIAHEYSEQYKVIKKITIVTVTSAKPLSKEVLDAIRQKLLKSSSTSDNIEIITKVDPTLIGGFILEYDDKLFDNSVVHKLDLLKKEFKDNLYVSQIAAN